MKVAVFDTHRYERDALEAANLSSGTPHELHFLETRLDRRTVDLARGCDAVCCFVNDRIDADALSALRAQGVRIVALRCAGYNNVDVDKANSVGISVVRVPEYSPYAVAEHAAGLLLTLVRKTHKAFNRVHEMNFSLDGLVGFDLHGKTVGIVGTGRIGRCFGNIMNGFGCRLLATDLEHDSKWAQATGCRYVEKDELLDQSDVISLHVPLNGSTLHYLDADAFDQMKSGAIVINTGRGALIDSSALVQALKRKKIGGACLDVYEEEEGVFFSDLSETGIDDDCLARLITFPNVLITSHQAFLTREALEKIASTTIDSLSKFEHGKSLAGVRVGAGQAHAEFSENSRNEINYSPSDKRQHAGSP